MTQINYTHSIRWITVVLAAIAFQTALGASDAWADEETKDSEKLASAASGSGLFAAETDEAGSARAITRQQREDGSLIVQVIEDDKMIRIAQRPGKGITVILVETVRDTEKVNRYTAKNVEALKSRHPRAFEVYERYANSDPMVTTSDFSGMKNKSDAERAQATRQLAQIQQMQQQIQQMQQQLRQQQAQAQQRAGMQRAAQFSRGAWGFGSARASGRASGSSQASGSARSGSSSSGSSSSGSSSSGK